MMVLSLGQASGATQGFLFLRGKEMIRGSEPFAGRRRQAPFTIMHNVEPDLRLPGTVRNEISAVTTLARPGEDIRANS